MILSVLILAALALSIGCGLSDIRTGYCPRPALYLLLLTGAGALLVRSDWLELALYLVCIFTTRGGWWVCCGCLFFFALVIFPLPKEHIWLWVGMVIVWGLYIATFWTGGDFNVGIALLAVFADIQVLYWIFGVTILYTLAAWIWKYRDPKKIIRRILSILSLHPLQPQWEDPDTIIAPGTAIASAGAVLYGFAWWIGRI